MKIVIMIEKKSINLYSLPEFDEIDDVELYIDSSKSEEEIVIDLEVNISDLSDIAKKELFKKSCIDQGHELITPMSIPKTHNTINNSASLMKILQTIREMGTAKISVVDADFGHESVEGMMVSIEKIDT